jgi:pseudoazurin
VTTRRVFLTALAGTGALMTMPAARLRADVHEIRLLNRGEAGSMVFEPRLLRLPVGSTVRFVPADRGHSVESVDGMVPEGGPTWRGGINEEVEVTLDVEGVYGVLCRPHYAMGMVALIAVGEDLHNLRAAKAVSHPGRAGRVFEELLSEL